MCIRDRVVPMAFLSFGTYEALRVVLDRAVDEALGVGAVPGKPDALASSASAAATTVSRRADGEKRVVADVAGGGDVVERG